MATIGSYKGVPITSGTDAQVAAQVAAIDAKSSAPRTLNMGTTSPTQSTPPAYNPASGTLTDYGKSVGATPMSGGQPARNLDSSLPTPPATPSYQPTSTQATPGSQAYTQFNAALMGLLKTQQGMGTRGFQEQSFNAQEKQNNTILAPTSADFVGAAPSTQNSVRSNAVEAVQPLVTQAGNATQTFGEQIRSLGDAISAAKSFGDSYMSHQENMQSQARDNITQAMQIGGAAGLEAVKKANPDIFKVAGLDYDSLLAAAQAQEKYTQSKPVEVQPGNTLVDPTTGQSIYSAPKSTSGSTATTSTLAGLQSGKTLVSGNLKYAPTQYTQDRNSLISSRGTDGWVDPAIYLRGYNAWISGGGLKSDFLQVYPLKDYINPANSWPEIQALRGTTSTRSA